MLMYFPNIAVGMPCRSITGNAFCQVELVLQHCVVVHTNICTLAHALQFGKMKLFVSACKSTAVTLHGGDVCRVRYLRCAAL